MRVYRTMNDSWLLAIAVWRTASKRRQTRAENICKNYGLSRVQPALYIGRLSFRERRELEQKLHTLLNGKRDSLDLFSSCRSCAAASTARQAIEKQYEETTFEIV